MLSLSEIYKQMENLKHFTLDGDSLACSLEFKDFNQALEFVNEVGLLAKEQNHSPMIILDNTLVQLRLTTHETHSVTEKDFALAHSIEEKLNKENS